MTFSGRFLLSMIQFASSRGGDLGELMSLTGHDYAFLCDEESRVEADVYNRVLEQSIGDTSDDLFGLHAGENLNLAAAGLIGQISQTSSTVKEALHYCCEFANLGCRALPMSLEKRSEDYLLAFVPDQSWKMESEIAAKQTIDGTLAFTLREFHLLTTQNHYPLEVGFDHVKDENHAEYERIFKCPIKYNCEKTYMLFSSEHVESKVVTSDFNLLRILVDYANLQLESLQSNEGFESKVKRSIINLMSPHFPSVLDVATNLNLSSRTLQRKLEEENCSFKEVLESTKKEMALNYLAQKQYEIKMIADLLGYSDTSAFNRSFKRWTAMTPGAYRMQN